MHFSLIIQHLVAKVLAFCLSASHALETNIIILYLGTSMTDLLVRGILWAIEGVFEAYIG